MGAPAIENVSDTALWVATYRAMESERPDALFHDRLAGRLVGERGRAIAAQIKGSRYTSWSVVVRTCIIDAFIRELVAGGVDTVLNLGAGLDTRPYRLDLPPMLRWIEVDFGATIDFKNERLAGETPRCRLERRAVDLGDPVARHALLEQVNAQAKRVFVLTEGVVGYLSNADVGALAADLKAQPRFAYWVLEYFTAQFRKIELMMSRRRHKQLANAPVQFQPGDWRNFFAERGWSPREI